MKETEAINRTDGATHPADSDKELAEAVRALNHSLNTDPNWPIYLAILARNVLDTLSRVRPSSPWVGIETVEDLPKEAGKFLVTQIYRRSPDTVEEDWFTPGETGGIQRWMDNYSAWMPLPDPYQPIAGPDEGGTK